MRTYPHRIAKIISWFILKKNNRHHFLEKHDRREVEKEIKNSEKYVRIGKVFCADLKNKKNISINILGACFLRDAFGMGKVFGDYRIEDFIQSNSILSMNSETFSYLTSEKILPDDMSKTHLCWYKWLNFDVEKSVLEYLSNTKTDYLIFGLTETIYNLIKIEDKDGKFCYLTTSHGISKIIFFPFQNFQI